MAEVRPVARFHDHEKPYFRGTASTLPLDAD
jgi:hypothetical protein